MQVHKMLCLLCLLYMIFSVTDSQRRWRRNRCRRPSLENGITRMRDRGRVLRYKCRRGFRLYGSKFNACVARRWRSPHSICVRSGCPDLGEWRQQGQVIEPIPGAVRLYGCSPGYKLLGHPTMYCDGRGWNGTEPTCAAEFRTGPVSYTCDFESEDLCGWSHGERAEFLWTRHSGITPSADMLTGPRHDHTLGTGLDGHYMYIEASTPREENDTARLFSPVYPATASQNACISYWYHMRGSSLGHLKVYVLPEDVSLDDLDGPERDWTQNRGDRWIQDVISISQQNSPFQIVFEGVRGENYMGDIALDDVELVNGDRCGELTSSIVPAPGDNAAGATNASFHGSCRDRCDEPDDMENPCSCTEDCLLDRDCCDDFVSICLDEPEAQAGNGDEKETTTRAVSASSSVQSSTATAATGEPPATSTFTPPEPTTQTSSTTTATAQTTTTATSPATSATSTQSTTASTTSTQRAVSTPTTTTTTTVRTTAETTTTQRGTTVTRQTTTTTTSSTTTTASATTTTTTQRTTATTIQTSPTSATTSSTTDTIIETTTTALKASTVSPHIDNPVIVISEATTQGPESGSAVPVSSTGGSPATGTKGQSQTPTSSSTEMSNELPVVPDSGDEDNVIPQARRAWPLAGSAGSGPSSGGLPLYAVLALVAGGLLLVSGAVAVAVWRCRRVRPSRLSDQDDSQVFFTGAEQEGDPSLDLRLRSKPQPVPSRAAPAASAPAPVPASRNSAELQDFSLDQFCDESETARLTGN